MPGPVVANMFCLLRLELELSIQAKAMLLARQAGVDVPVDERPGGESRGTPLPAPVDQTVGLLALLDRCRSRVIETPGTAICSSSRVAFTAPSDFSVRKGSMT